LLKRTLMVTAVCLVLASSSGAVLIDSGDGTGNTTAPTPDPNWDNIGVGSGLTVTYLGDGWVLTAAHVGEITVAIDGGVYPPVLGSQVVLIHSGTTESDVAIYRIDPYPSALPAMTIRSVAVPVSETVIMVGNGRNRGTPTTWQSPPTEDGYNWASGKAIRWGTNEVSAAGIDLVSFGKTTRSFYTSFTQAGTSSEGQATIGDSGGPTFTLNGASWELAGVMFATNLFLGQPAETSIYGNLTFSVDLSYYRQQILDIMAPDCGNGHLTIDEDCDDGNTADGDCCSSTCTFEAALSSCEDGLVCTGPDSCDGAGACVTGSGDPCDDSDPCTADSCDEMTGCAHAPIQSPECSTFVPASSNVGRVSLLIGIGGVGALLIKSHSRLASLPLG